jgi:glycosyltransferase involved in cell wall biosynthesis
MTSEAKKILWFTWKDLDHPHAGGAEAVNEELARRLVADGFEVRFIVGGFAGAAPTVTRNGYQIIRQGNRVTLYLLAIYYYLRHLRDWPDVVIEEINTVPFFTKFYVRGQRWLFIHQLSREVWFHEIFFPLNWIGWLIEPIYLRLLSDQRVITVSTSTKNDLQRFGFNPARISIISEGIRIAPVRELNRVPKFAQPTMIAVGAIRSMKQTDQIVKAFELAKARLPKLRLVVAGAAEGRYGQRVLRMIENSRFAADIEYRGRVSEFEKVQLMQQAQVLCVASVKEGWGLVVTEANSQGTPAAVYNVDGLRDSVRDGITGLICRVNTPAAMAANVEKLLSDAALYKKLQLNAWEWCKSITFDQSYRDLFELL